MVRPQPQARTAISSPKTRALSIIDGRSLGSIQVRTEFQNTAGGTLYRMVLLIWPDQSATQKNSRHCTGDITTIASTRGTTRYSTGSVRSIVIASICSVTFIVPSWAA